MDQEIVCPHCGTHVRLDDAPSPDVPEGFHPTAEILVPATASSTEVGALKWLPSAPDPILAPASLSASSSSGEVPSSPETGGASVEVNALLDAAGRPPAPEAESASGVILIDSTGSAEAAGLAVAVATPPGEPPGDVETESRAGPEAADFLSALVQGGGPTAPGEAEAPPAIVETLPGLDLAASPAQEPPPAPAPEPDEDDDEETPRTSWSLVLLGSYASAMTLACIYLLWFAPRRPALPETLPTDSRPDRGGEGLRGVAAPIPADQITTVGTPLRVGSLELTPLAIEAGHATLERLKPDGKRERTDGGPDSLILRLRLRNLSPDAAFSPIDRAFVRQPDRGMPHSYIELENGGLLEDYPLALESERSILGQSFEELGPNQARETVVVSDQGALPLAQGAMIWRLRVRTGPDQVDTVGIRFDDSDIQ